MAAILEKPKKLKEMEAKIRKIKSKARKAVAVEVAMGLVPGTKILKLLKVPLRSAIKRSVYRGYTAALVKASRKAAKEIAKKKKQ